jgi:hypothetical protein
MYKIIGADQKEYGPISADQMRQWIREGRVSAQTQAQAEGQMDWRPVIAFPEFAEAFAATPGAAASPTTLAGGGGGRDAALAAVKGPAIGLIVTAILGILYYGVSGVFTIVTGGAMFHQEMPPNVPPELQSFIKGMQGPGAGLINLVIVALNAFVLFGAVKLMRLQSHGLVMAACVVAMLPCQCCCMLGLPFGIWAVIVINKPEVKSQFT